MRVHGKSFSIFLDSAERIQAMKKQPLALLGSTIWIVLAILLVLVVA
jgi:hypothetical protein